MTRFRSVAAWTACAAAALAVSACVSGADEAPVQFDCPSSANWPIVSQVLERRCGTIDCHGHASRPLRLLGRNGMRLSERDQVGIDPTSDAELEQNRMSVCGLEPELMTAVMAGEAEVGELTVSRKALLSEAHKGGRVWVDDSDGYGCFVSWVDENVDVQRCADELELP